MQNESESATAQEARNTAAQAAAGASAVRDDMRQTAEHVQDELASAAESVKGQVGDVANTVKQRARTGRSRARSLRACGAWRFTAAAIASGVVSVRPCHTILPASSLRSLLTGIALKASRTWRVSNS